MTRCVTDLALERYLLGELDAAGEREHIASCVVCRTALAAKQAAGDAYMASPPARTVLRMIEALEPAVGASEIGSSTPHHPHRPRSIRRRPRAVVALAALAIALVLLAVVWPRGPTDPEAEVLDVAHAWMTAYVDNDVDALDAILADDYKLTDGAGHTSTKADDLADARRGQTHFDAYDTTDMRVRVWGDTAVITGRSKIRGNSAGRPFAHDITFTDTLARIDGRWRAVAAHVSKTRPP